jgi:hypothetical protein
VAFVPPRPVQRKVELGPLWKGPEVDGITNSLLSKFLVCRHRFYLRVVKGLKEDKGFSHYLEYGQLWHEAEEALAQGDDWKARMHKYCESLYEKYMGSEAQIAHWYSVCKTQFPIYVKHWKRHPNSRAKKYIFQEYEFNEPYKLPSGRIVRIRGKIDGGSEQRKGILIQENKTKGKIDDEGLQRTVDQNVQTMIYNTAARILKKKEGNPISASKLPLKGTMYNVIRRPLSDNYAIRQKKTESSEQFYKRLGKSIEAQPDRFFKRWDAYIYDRDIKKFATEILDPVLQQLCDWWDWIKADPAHPFRTGNTLHFRLPFGIYNAMFDGQRGEYFDLLTTGSEVGLVKVDNLFPELGKAA